MNFAGSGDCFICHTNDEIPSKIVAPFCIHCWEVGMQYFKGAQMTREQAYFIRGFRYARRRSYDPDMITVPATAFLTVND